MCGIVGYIGKDKTKDFLLSGLKELEYRGYDSAGIAIATNNDIFTFKAVGKLKNLEQKMQDFDSKGTGLGIGHTRWATHGKPTELNAHPHSTINAHLVHNGIIENYQELKSSINAKFKSQTDTEVIAHLFDKFYDQSHDSFKAFEQTIFSLEGSFALLLISPTDKGKIFFAKNKSPLELSTSKNEVFFASSDAPLIGFAKNAYYLEDGIYGFASVDECKFYKDKKEISLKPKSISQSLATAQKEGFSYFMEKEIYEQKQVLADVLNGRITDEKIILSELDSDFTKGVKRIRICACGTSYHAGLVGEYLFGKLSNIPLRVEIASEFRYKKMPLEKDELFIVISQSGETADSLEALKIAKKAGLKTLAICNVDNSSIVRLADKSMLTRAGIEKGVASTKAFSAQVMSLWLIASFLSKEKIQTEIKAMRSCIKAVEVKPETRTKLSRISKRYLHGHGFFFIGRDIFYPLALEGALKLKEISYLHAEGYPAGEMKHGPIALVDKELFTIALLPKTTLYEKTKSNIEELSARDSTIFAITPTDLDLADDIIKTTPYNHYMEEFFEMLVILQIFAMEISIRLGNDVDMPRNLAKSVTVE